MIELAAAFDLWRERCMADPDSFLTPVGADASEEYGIACARYLEELVDEVRERQAVSE
jgi:hypothetical protein